MIVLTSDRNVWKNLGEAFIQQWNKIDFVPLFFLILSMPRSRFTTFQYLPFRDWLALLTDCRITTRSYNAYLWTIQIWVPDMVKPDEIVRKTISSSSFTMHEPTNIWLLRRKIQNEGCSP